MMSTNKVRVLCRFGGNFICDSNKVYYKGGTNRIAHVDRAINYLTFLSKVCEICKLTVVSSIKYKSPGLDLESLLPIENDNDVSNMMEAFPQSGEPIHLYVFVVQNLSITIPIPSNLMQNADTGNVQVSLRDLHGSNETLGPSSPNINANNDDVPSASNDLHETDCLLMDSCVNDMPKMMLILKEGQEFEDANAFYKALSEYAVRLNFQYKQTGSGGGHYQAKCIKGDCSWRIHACKLPDKLTFKIKSLQGNHTCNAANESTMSNTTTHRQATRKQIAALDEDRLQKNMHCTPKDIVDGISRECGIKLSNDNAWRGKELALKELHCEQSITPLTTICEEIQTTNTGSTTKISSSLQYTQMMSTNKVRVLCRFGGNFICDSNKVYYKGGTNRIAHVDRAINYLTLLSKVCGICKLTVVSSIKYKPPGLDLESLVPIENDNDVSNMMEAFPQSSEPIHLYVFVVQNLSITIPIPSNMMQNADTGNVQVSLRDLHGSNETLGPSSPNINANNDDVPSASNDLRETDCLLMDSCVNDMPKMMLILKEGQEFEDANAFYKALSEYAIRWNFQYKQTGSGGGHYQAKCIKGDCSWRIHACKLPDKLTFKIKSLQGNHTCNAANESTMSNTTTHRQASRKQIAALDEDRLQKNMHCTPKDIVDGISRECGIKLSNDSAWRGKELALKELHCEQSITPLTTICEEIQTTNTGSTTKISSSLQHTQMMSTNKVRVLCRFGGNFIWDSNKVYYKGGTNRIAHVDRAINYLTLLSKVCGICKLTIASSIKYKSPGLDLESLVPIENDNDVSNMMEAFPQSSEPIHLYVFVVQNLSITIPIPSNLMQNVDTGNVQVSLRDLHGSNETHGPSSPNINANNDDVPSASNDLHETDCLLMDGCVNDMLKMMLILKEGQEFENANAFIKALSEYAVRLNFQYKHTGSGGGHYQAKCIKGDCSWRIHACKLPDKLTFKIKSLQGNHTCNAANESTMSNTTMHRQASRKRIAALDEDRLQKNLHYTPKDIMDEISRECRIKVSNDNAWRGKEVSLKEMHYEQSITPLTTICEEIQTTNPGSTTKISSIDESFEDVIHPKGDPDAVSISKIDVELLQPETFIIDQPFEDVIYPEGDADAVSISKGDIELLQAEKFINDTIIDFYIQYLKNNNQLEDKHRFHFFNCFFFRKLADLDKDPESAKEGRAAFLRVCKWTRKVNIFEKDYIFIPVNFKVHWSLIVICHPGEVANFEDEEFEKAPKVPCILHMDSSKGSHIGLNNLIQSYLWEEWKERRRESSNDVSLKFSKLRFVPLELPQQENSFDCGLFLLHYVELFLKEAPVNFSPIFSKFLNVDWFLPSEASHKRSVIQKLIFELPNDHSPKNPPAACSGQHSPPKFQEIGA
ncbi:uncharacterized protein LOC131247947 isoform X2 [Magnolia sinica]|nr:uncharacterized protein LOC131247947 isoform X2 [Magnolia sinica]XP_058103925.1 uncharacterized protein LOC131247947 isoform X2 [Magnolia sinica]